MEIVKDIKDKDVSQAYIDEYFLNSYATYLSFENCSLRNISLEGYNGCVAFKECFIENIELDRKVAAVSFDGCEIKETEVDIFGNIHLWNTFIKKSSLQRCNELYWKNVCLAETDLYSNFFSNVHNDTLDIVSVGGVGRAGRTVHYIVPADIVICGCWTRKNVGEKDGLSLSNFCKALDEAFAAGYHTLSQHMVYKGAVAFFKECRKSRGWFDV